MHKSYSLYLLCAHCRRKIADVCQEIQQYQNTPYCLLPETSIQVHINLCVDSHPMSLPKVKVLTVARHACTCIYSVVHQWCVCAYIIKALRPNNMYTNLACGDRVPLCVPVMLYFPLDFVRVT